MPKNLRAKLTRRLGFLRQFRRPVDYWLLLRLFIFASSTPWLMRLTLPTLANLLTPRRQRRAPDPAQVTQIITCTDAMLSMGRPLVQASCLTRGLTLYYFLQQAGLPVELHFGVNRTQEKFGGHCWLVQNGEPFAEAHDPTKSFTTVYRLTNRGIR